MGNAVGLNVRTRQSRRGGWDAFVEVAGLQFSGHGGTEAEAVADLLAAVELLGDEAAA